MSEKVTLIVAVADNNVIGKDNDLVWRLRDDMRFFKETTTGHIILTGRKNFESIPEKFRPLPDRLNCILTRNPEYDAPGCELFSSVSGWLETYQNDERNLFIIGGGEVYRESLEKGYVTEMFITHVHGEPEGDTFFPDFDKEDWTISVVGTGEKNERNDYSFTIKKYTRK